MKKPLLPLLAILFLATCEKESTSELVTDQATYEDGLRKLGTAAFAKNGNGNQIVFDSDHDGNAEIYVMNNDGIGQSNISNNSSNYSNPDWY